jgi:outer membrane immunogenic protein
MEGQMRKSVLLVGATLLLAGPALAADLSKPPVYKAPALVPALSWSGWYIGANAGWVGSANDNVTNTGTDTDHAGLGTLLATGLIPGSVPVKLSGFIGGGQIGYNWQAGNLVFGLEADFDGISAKGDTAAVSPGSLTTPFATMFNRELDWLGTFRGRLGFTIAPPFLVYATGGLAVGETKIGNSFSCPTCLPPSFTQASTANIDSNTSAGWTVGAGAEWMFAPNWSVKAEYLYVDLGSHSSTSSYAYGPGGTTVFNSTLTSTVRDTEHIVRAGINFHF